MGYLFQDESGFPAHDPASGYHKGREVTVVLKASLEILALLLFFMGLQAFVWDAGVLGFVVQIGHPNINYAMLGSIPEAADEDIAPFFTEFDRFGVGF